MDAFGTPKRFRYHGWQLQAQEADAQTIPTTTWTLVTYNDRDDFDPLDGHSTTFQTSRLYVKQSGVYIIYGFVYFAPNAVNERYLRIEKNAGGVVVGGTFIASQDYPASIIVGGGTSISLTGFAYLNAGDYIEAFVFQRSGGDLNIGGIATAANKLGFAYLGE